ncbi:neurogenic locus Notch protein-like isoform X2 [Patiria miniata]|uniref:Uncharacterized protein n=1 Tax=Patiria miniata TaxID=46514 RepID=A0A914ARD0_PATMI|nr:neurogenic locus Notch protein-like isoform X2 [Patiria miniata]
MLRLFLLVALCHAISALPYAQEANEVYRDMELLERLLELENSHDNLESRGFEGEKEMNLAGRHKSQSSAPINKDEVEMAAKAIDGRYDDANLLDENGEVDGGSCTVGRGPEANPHWVLLLGGDHCITKVSILNRGDGHSERLTGAVVRVGREPSLELDDNTGCDSPVTAEQAAVPGGTVDFECSQPVLSRYVIIGIPSDNAIIQLCEVRVWEVPLEQCLPGPEGQQELNVVGGDAEQSFRFKGLNTTQWASKAVDGQYDNDMFVDSQGEVEGGSCSFTGPEENSWWKLNLGEMHCISRVSVLTGTGGAGLAADAVVNVGIGPSTVNSQCGSPVSSSQAAAGGTTYFNCNPPIKADTLIISTARPAMMLVCETRVYEVPMDQCNQGRELQTELNIVGSDVSQASVTGEFNASKAVDGRYDDGKMIHDVDVEGGSCSMTGFQEDPYWRLALNESHCISRVSILNRADGQSERLFGATVTAVGSGDSIQTCGSSVTAEQAAVPGATILIDCDSPILANVLRISIDSSNASLQMCEVRVWEVPLDQCPGTDMDECASVPCQNGAECVNGVNKFSCVCAAGFTGDLCETGSSTVNIGETEVNITGSQAFQSSAVGERNSNKFAKKVVDGRYHDTKLLGEDGEMYGGSCTITEAEENPHLGIVLDKPRCISRVSILNRGDGDSERLTGTIVKVGNSGGFELNWNTVCGSPVTAEQAAVPGGTVDFKCSQLPGLSQAIIIGIPSPNATLQLCEVRVWELPIDQCKKDASLGCAPNPCVNAECAPGPDGQAFCKCFDGQNGDFCEATAMGVRCEPSSDEDRYIYDQYEGNIQSPGYPEPYGINLRCPYIIGSPDAKMIELRFDDVDVNFKMNNFLVYQPGGTLSSRSDDAVRLKNFPNETIVVNDNKVWIFFQTTYANQDKQKGFRLHFRILTDECGSDPCQNGAECMKGDKAFSCACVAGFTGQLCETDIDECGSDPCQNGAECVDAVNGVSCTCAAGFTGPLCETDIDECGSDPCKNGAECVDGVNEFSCMCAAGFTGPFCETDIDECASDPCQNSAECVDGVNEFSCTCAAGFTGPMCETGIDECGSDPCQNGAECADGDNEFSCTCAAGFTGPLCETDIDECGSSPCQNGVCRDKVNGFSCECSPGFEGKLCETNTNECASDPCKNGGECVDGVNEFSCTCAAGFTGTLCETGIDECGSSPCQNGVCQDEVNGFSCECSPGYEGQLCETNINGCEGSPCQNGVCHDEVDGFSCKCSPGFEGTLCDSNVDECGSDPCQNGAECVDGVNEFACTCAAGFTGPLCETDIDECGSDPCQNGAECVDGGNEFSCTCAAGFTGDLCDKDIDECESNPCQNGVCHDEGNGFSCECSAGYRGTLCKTVFVSDKNGCKNSPCKHGNCLDEVDGFSCECSPGYEGTLCKIDTDECASDPCQNEGVCVDEVNGFSCQCSPGYAGDLCETNIDECASNPCQNGAECVDGVNEFSCTCAAGFTGALCETAIAERVEPANSCDSSPCQNGVCRDEVDGFSCECSQGYEGTLCDSEMKATYACTSNPCKNGVCINYGAKFQCVCSLGFTGTLCEIGSAEPVEPVNACHSNPCKNGVCHNKVDGFSCECSSGYEGTLCETKAPFRCTTNPCKNGICINYGEHGFMCACSPGYRGTACEINVDECSSDPCQNGAVCVDGINTISCKCASGYTGRLCEIEQPGGLLEKPSQLSLTLPVGEVTETNYLQVNLVAEYCIKKVVVHKRGDCTGARLTGAVVRAGTSSTGLNNGMCGSALTAQQAEVRRSTVDFVCDPPLTAKFVTVDIPLLRVTKQQICEVTVEQGTPGPCYE